MSVYSSNITAESVGYNNGHALGHVQGQEQGQIDGWNQAVEHLTPVIADRDATIQRLLDANAQLEHQLAQQQQYLELQHEQAQSVRADYEAMHKAFLGVIALATPAMRYVALQPLAERDQFFTTYCENSIKLQGQDYVRDHRFPHNQPLVKQYLPIAHSVVSETIAQIKRQRASAASDAAPAA